MRYSEVLQNILRLYGLSEPIERYENLVDECVGTDRLYLITYVKTTTRQLIVSLSRRKERTKQAIEESVAFAEYLRQNGVRTPKFYRTAEGYRRDVRVDGVTASVTVNDYVGEPVTQVTADDAYALGVELGKMHRLSMESQMQVSGKDVLFNGFEGDWDGMRLLKILDKDGLLPHNKFLRCRRAYSKLNEVLRQSWQTLPRAAVQGNLQPKHLSFADDVWIFGFENAGVCTLLSDMVLEGLSLAFSCPHGEEELGGEVYCAFEDGYLSERKLTAEEERLYEPFLYTAQALWRDTLLQEEGVATLARKGDTVATDGKMKALYTELEGLLGGL